MNCGWEVHGEKSRAEIRTQLLTEHEQKTRDCRRDKFQLWRQMLINDNH